MIYEVILRRPGNPDWYLLTNVEPNRDRPLLLGDHEWEIVGTEPSEDELTIRYIAQWARPARVNTSVRGLARAR